jgi:hydroxymethylpyrimidine pyrophosphatase-like HAD family hydrolase
MGIPVEQAMVMGDSSNDLPAFAVAGWAVAVRNAQPAVQAAADVVTLGSCDEDAVAEAVERFVLG